MESKYGELNISLTDGEWQFEYTDHDRYTSNRGRGEKVEAFHAKADL